MPLNALIVGLGSIGRRHLANLRALEPSAHITILRHQPAEEAVAQANRVVYRLEDALDPRPDVAIIANPASRHVETALALAQHNVHLFIEKPVADRLDGLMALLVLCDERHLTLMVGYNLRFAESLRRVHESLGSVGRVMSVRVEAGRYLPYWRPNADYRETVSARRDLGGGALLELSHEFDYVRWLVGEVESVSAWTGKLSDLEIDVEDMAEVTLRFASGAVGSVHLDLVQHPGIRTCRVIGTLGTVVWDGMTHHTQVYRDADGAWTELYPANTVDRNAMYVAELEHFLACVRDQGPPAIAGEDGLRTLQIVLAARQSSDEGRVIALPLL